MVALSHAAEKLFALVLIVIGVWIYTSAISLASDYINDPM